MLHETPGNPPRAGLGVNAFPFISFLCLKATGGRTPSMSRCLHPAPSRGTLPRQLSCSRPASLPQGAALPALPLPPLPGCPVPRRGGLSGLSLPRPLPFSSPVCGSAFFARITSRTSSARFQRAPAHKRNSISNNSNILRANFVSIPTPANSICCWYKQDAKGCERGERFFSPLLSLAGRTQPVGVASHHIPLPY